MFAEMSSPVIKNNNYVKASRDASPNGSNRSEMGATLIEAGRPRTGSFVSQTEWTSESKTMFACQVILPFIICGFGNLGAGQLLDIVQEWNVFRDVPELYVLIPSLMGLKGAHA